eukprot:scaffold638_cov84-Isochrysis_galbana.AAC.1
MISPTYSETSSRGLIDWSANTPHPATELALGLTLELRLALAVRVGPSPDVARHALVLRGARVLTGDRTTRGRNLLLSGPAPQRPLDLIGREDRRPHALIAPG